MIDGIINNIAVSTNTRGGIYSHEIKTMQGDYSSLWKPLSTKVKEGKGPAYTRWATIYNLKQMAAALQYLQEQNLLAYDDLTAKADALTERYHNIGDKLKGIETAVTRNNALKTVIANYARTRLVFEEYKTKKYSNKFLAEHETEISKYRDAQATMKALLGGERLPKMETLKAEWQGLMTAKKTGYADYRAAQKEMRKIITVKANIDQLLGLSEPAKDKEMER